MAPGLSSSRCRETVKHTDVGWRGKQRASVWRAEEELKSKRLSACQSVDCIFYCFMTSWLWQTCWSSCSSWPAQLHVLFLCPSFSSAPLPSPNMQRRETHSATVSVLIWAGGCVCVCVCVCVYQGYVLWAGIGFRLEALSIPFSLCPRAGETARMWVSPQQRNDCFWKSAWCIRNENNNSAGENEEGGCRGGHG